MNGVELEHLLLPAADRHGDEGAAYLSVEPDLYTGGVVSVDGELVGGGFPEAVAEIRVGLTQIARRDPQKHRPAESAATHAIQVPQATMLTAS